MNEIINNIVTRRSCKSFRSDMLPYETIDKIVEAGLYAASGMGKQSPIILVVTNKGIRDKLSQLNAKYDLRNRPDPFYNAPVVLSVLAPESIPTAIYDGSLVIGNMMLAAHSLDIGSCWIHRAKEVFQDEEGKKLLDDLGITGEYEGIGNCVIGFPERTNSTIIPRRDNRVYKI
ncbi:MAG: nitroreductase family protein [Candidatus Atribacteria bacterium]|nr:nitroreductase family protein [Candidatus Atribacteria bacterium]